MTAQIKLVIVLVVLGLAGAGFWYYGHWMYGEGKKAAELTVAQRDNKDLIAARAEVSKLNADVRALEDQHAIEVAAIDTQGQEELRRVQAAKEKFVGDVVAGRIRLFDPYTRCPGNSADSASKVASALSVGDAARGAELSKPLANFLIGEASRADQVVVKLTTCQTLLGQRSLGATQ